MQVFVALILTLTLLPSASASVVDSSDPNLIRVTDGANSSVNRYDETSVQKIPVAAVQAPSNSLKYLACARTAEPVVSEMQANARSSAQKVCVMPVTCTAELSTVKRKRAKKARISVDTKAACLSENGQCPDALACLQAPTPEGILESGTEFGAPGSESNTREGRNK